MFLIPPFDWVVQELLHLDTARVFKELAGLPFDRKTLQRLAKGQASQRTADRSQSEYRKRHPWHAAHLDAFRARRTRELREQGREAQLELELSSWNWRGAIEGACDAAADAGERNLAYDRLRDLLLPLVDASYQAEVLFRQDAADSILDIVGACALGTFIDVPRLRREARQRTDRQAFSDALNPVRAVALLFILAAFDRQVFATGGNSIFESVLPEQDGNRYFTPMAKLIRQLEMGMSAASKSEAWRRLLCWDRHADDHTKLKTVRRWAEDGVFPEFRKFATLARSVAAARGRQASDKPITVLYYTLRYLTSLGELMREAPAIEHFGGYNGFFARYGNIVATLK